MSDEGQLGRDPHILLLNYIERRQTYRDFSGRIESLLKDILQKEGLRVHSITSRAKTLQSFEEKVKAKDYHELDEIPDLAGVRIITHMSDEVHPIASVIEREFDVIPEESVDKSELLDPDRFGYLSLHYVCRLSAERCGLPEYATYKGLVCEIQIRSVLQHAWAEIEHDLGYKSEQSIPRVIRRRFSRLAALLETADDEFLRIRDDLSNYEKDLVPRVLQEPATVPIDQSSLKTYIMNGELIRGLDEQFAEAMGAKLTDPSPRAMGLDLATLPRFGITTIKELDDALTKRATLIKGLQDAYSGHHHADIHRGVSIFHLIQVLFAETGDASSIAAFYGEWGIAPWANSADLADALIKRIAGMKSEFTSESN